jgi:hypothetical protein
MLGPQSGPHPIAEPSISFWQHHSGGPRPELQSQAAPASQARQCSPARSPRGKLKRSAIQHHVPSTTEARSRGMPIPAPLSIRATPSGFNREPNQRDEHHGSGTPTGDSGGEHSGERLDLAASTSALTAIQRSRNELVHQTHRALAERSDAKRLGREKAALRGAQVAQQPIVGMRVRISTQNTKGCGQCRPAIEPGGRRQCLPNEPCTGHGGTSQPRSDPLALTAGASRRALDNIGIGFRPCVDNREDRICLGPGPPGHARMASS